MTLSYIVGQKYHPIKYPIRAITTYLLLTALIFASMNYLRTTTPQWLSLTANTLLITLFAALILLTQRKKKNTSDPHS